MGTSGLHSDHSNNIVCARDIYEALTVENETVRGLSTYHCTLKKDSKKSANAFPGISQMYSFDFEEAGVRSRGQYGIGEGEVTKKDKLPTNNSSLDIVDDGGHTGDSFWSSLECGENEKKKVDEEDEEINYDDLFHCSTIGCIKSFRTTRWLDNHEKIGNHVFAEKKQSMTDRAVKKFNELIETREAARIAVAEQVEASGEDEMAEERKKSWALKSSHPTRTLDTKAKEIAAEYFYSQRSLNPPRRADPAAMRKRLIDAKDPSDPTGSRYLLEYAAIPSEKQLQSLFSRLESSRLKATAAKVQKTMKAGNEPGPKRSTATAAKVQKTMKADNEPSASMRITRSKSNVKATIGDTRKRTVVKDSEDSENSEVMDDMEDEDFEDDDVFEEMEEEETDDEEILGMHEEDFIRRVILEDNDDIFK